jgi:hypothetical protein
MYPAPTTPADADRSSRTGVIVVSFECGVVSGHLPSRR